MTMKRTGAAVAACLALALAFSACQQPTDDDDSGNIWDVSHSYGTNRLANKTVYKAGEGESTATWRIIFSGNTYKVETTTPAGNWDNNLAVSEAGTYVTNGFTHSVSFYRTQRVAALFLSFTTLVDYFPGPEGESVLTSLGAKATTPTSEGLVDEAGMLNILAAYFTRNPDQYAKLPATPWGAANIGRSDATSTDINDFWTNNINIVAQGYTNDDQGRKDYVRDLFVIMKASPTSPTRLDGTLLDLSSNPNSPQYTWTGGVPYL
jgi:hypothetical protein